LAPDKILSDVSIYSNHSFENIFKLIIGWCCLGSAISTTGEGKRTNIHWAWLSFALDTLQILSYLLLTTAMQKRHQ
jgi:hypothetical protein